MRHEQFYWPTKAPGSERWASGCLEGGAKGKCLLLWAFPNVSRAAQERTESTELGGQLSIFLMPFLDAKSPSVPWR